MRHTSIVILCILLAAACLTGCRSSTAETDGAAPSVELLVSGPGIELSRMANPPRHNWSALELVLGAEYQFTLTVRDPDGIGKVAIEFPSAFQIHELSSPAVREHPIPDVGRYTVTLSPDSPTPNLVLTGRFNTPADLVHPWDPSPSLQNTTRVEDLGGRSGDTPNQTILVLGRGY
jgi:hypothetical protein